MEKQRMLLFPGRRRVPTFAQAIEALQETPAYIYQALEHGTEVCRTYFRDLSNDDRPRPHIREMIVRDQAKRYLEGKAFSVDDDPLALADEPMAAILLRIGAMQIRILKGPEGVVPGCGTSTRRRDFYSQKPDYYLLNGERREVRLNLLLIWDFDSVFNLGQLWLSCPVGAGATPSEVRCLWHELLPHPATIVRPVRGEDEQQRAEKEIERMLQDIEESEEEEIAKS